MASSSSLKIISVFFFAIYVTNNNKQIAICVAVYTDHGKVRALIRAALNERALERYISIWLSDTTGLNTYFESWALIRDNEACNLLPSIAAGQYGLLYFFSFSVVLHSF